MNSEKIRTWIVENERASQNWLESNLKQHFENLELCGIIGTVKEAIEAFKIEVPDLVFLDIELDDGLVFEVFNHLSSYPRALIFTTAFDHFALQAIKLSAIDYLLKPISEEELIAAVNKALSGLELSSVQSRIELLLSNRDSSSAQRIALPDKNGLEFVNVQNIMSLKAEGSYTTFFLKENKKMMVAKPIRDYEFLCRDGFFRVHNSWIVNMGEIRRYVRGNGGYLIMNDEQRVEVASRRKHEFLMAAGIV